MGVMQLPAQRTPSRPAAAPAQPAFAAAAHRLGAQKQAEQHRQQRRRCRGRASLRCKASAHPPPPPGPAAAPPPPKRLAVFVSGGGSNFRAIHAAMLEGRIRGEVAVVVTNAPSCGGAAYAAGHGIPVLTYPPPKANPAAGLTPEQLVAELKQVRARGGQQAAAQGPRAPLGPADVTRPGKPLSAAAAGAAAVSQQQRPPLRPSRHPPQTHRVDAVALAGYMKLVPGALVRAFPRAVLNIHPGLLPSLGGQGFYGARVHAAVLASGARFSGPSVHFVDEEYDTGPILAQAVVPVYPTDLPEQLAARVLREVRGARGGGGVARRRGEGRDGRRVSLCLFGVAHRERSCGHRWRCGVPAGGRWFPLPLALTSLTCLAAGAPAVPRVRGGAVRGPHHLEGRRHPHHVERPLNNRGSAACRTAGPLNLCSIRSLLLCFCCLLPPPSPLQH